MRITVFEEFMSEGNRDTQVVTREENENMTWKNGSMFSRLYTDRRVKDSQWMSVLEWVGNQSPTKGRD